MTGSIELVYGSGSMSEAPSVCWHAHTAHPKVSATSYRSCTQLQLCDRAYLSALFASAKSQSLIQPAVTAASSTNLRILLACTNTDHGVQGVSGMTLH